MHDDERSSVFGRECPGRPLNMIVWPTGWPNSLLVLGVTTPPLPSSFPKNSAGGLGQSDCPSTSCIASLGHRVTRSYARSTRSIGMTALRPWTSFSSSSQGLGLRAMIAEETLSGQGCGLGTVANTKLGVQAP